MPKNINLTHICLKIVSKNIVKYMPYACRYPQRPEEGIQLPVAGVIQCRWWEPSSGSLGDQEAL